jgi:hypothetical protein
LKNTNQSKIVSKRHKIGSRGAWAITDRQRSIEILFILMLVFWQERLRANFCRTFQFSQSNKSIGMSLAFGTSWYFAWSKYFVCLVRSFYLFFIFIFLVNGSALIVISTGFEKETSYKDDGFNLIAYSNEIWAESL